VDDEIFSAVCSLSSSPFIEGYILGASGGVSLDNEIVSAVGILPSSSRIEGDVFGFSDAHRQHEHTAVEQVSQKPSGRLSIRDEPSIFNAAKAINRNHLQNFRRTHSHIFIYIFIYISIYIYIYRRLTGKEIQTTR